MKLLLIIEGKIALILWIVLEFGALLIESLGG